MNRAESTALEILKWAINPAYAVPEVQALDEALLMEAALHHRVFGSLVARLDADRPAWCPPRLLTRLRIKQHQTRQTVQTKIAAACDVSRAMRTRGLAPPIFVKGFAAYALTADAELMHYSGDLDPFAGDLLAFWDVLHEIGYAGKRKETHEWAKLSRGGITLDVHHYFPSLAYPDVLEAWSAASLEARQHPGRWLLPDERARQAFREARIYWGDLQEEAAPGVAAGTEGLLFPSPAHLAVIHCAHCFRVCMKRLHYMDLFGGFRFYELLSLHALARLPGFDTAKFGALVERFSAQDAVRFVNSLARRTLGGPAVPEDARRPSSETATFPERLTYGGWVITQATEDWLSVSGFDVMLDQLGVNVLPARCDLRGVADSRSLGYGQPAWEWLAADWRAGSASVALSWLVPPGADSLSGHELLVHFGYASSVKVRLAAEGRVENVTQKSDYLRPGQQATAESSTDACGVTVSLLCPVPVHPSRLDPGGSDSLPLFLAVRRLGADGETTEAATYLPLRLTA